MLEFLSHLTKVKEKARVSIAFGTGSNLYSFMTKDDVVHCRCQRGSHEYRTRIALAESDGTVNFNEELQFGITLYRAKDASVFDDKVFTVSVHNESHHDAIKPISAQIDFASLLTPTLEHGVVVEQVLVLELAAKPAKTVRLSRNESMVPSGKRPELRVVIQAWLGTGKPNTPAGQNVVESVPAHEQKALSLTAPRGLSPPVPSPQRPVNSFSAQRVGGHNEDIQRRPDLNMNVFVPGSDTKDHVLVNKHAASDIRSPAASSLILDRALMRPKQAPAVEFRELPSLQQIKNGTATTVDNKIDVSSNKSSDNDPLDDMQQAQQSSALDLAFAMLPATRDVSPPESNDSLAARSPSSGKRRPRASLL
ncbi:C2 NT-type domain-containing protein [Plasmodiophora brassicae]